MKIDENWSVEPDAACWTLTYRKEGPELNDKGIPKVSVSRSYHATLAQAFNSYIDESLKNSKEVEDIVVLLKACQDKVEKAVSGIKRI